MVNEAQQTAGGSSQRERYTLGYSAPATQSMERRTAASHAAFFLPHLRSGMSLLDCGCGPGTITVDLAEAVAPGQVIGIDLGESHIERATRLAAEQGLSNARFQTASVYQLPFPDSSFDAVFAHAILEHLKDPLKALEEMHRVLKPGGIIGVRSPDQGGRVVFPRDPVMEDASALYNRVIKHNGGSPLMGRELRRLLREAGFGRIEPSASCETWATPERTRMWGERGASHYVEPPFSEQVIQLGWADRAKLEEMASAWRQWGEHPDAFMVRVWGEAVGWKE